MPALMPFAEPGQRHPYSIASRLGVELLQQRYALFMTFFILYGTFIVRYGWQFRDIPNTDLPSFYAASVSVFRNGESPYNLESLRHVLPPADFTVFPYLYPPPSLLVFLPLSEMTYTHARQAALVLNHILILLLLWLIPWRLVSPWPRQNIAAIALCIVYILHFHPLILTLTHGQVNIICVTSLVLFWLLARSEHIVIASFFLALAILLKTYPVIVIPILWLIGRWREGLYAGAWLALPILASILFLPSSLWYDWLTDVLPTGGYTRIPAGLFSPAGIWNQGLNGFFARLFTESEWSSPIIVSPELARLLTYGTAILATATTGIAVWRSRAHSDTLDRALLVVLPLMYLVSPFSWEHHLVFLLPSILMLLNCRLSNNVIENIVFYSLCASTAIILGMPYALPIKFYAVVTLWLLCLFAATTKGIQLSTELTTTEDKRHRAGSVPL